MLMDDSTAEVEKEDLTRFRGGDLAVGRVVSKTFNRVKFAGVVEKYIPGARHI